MRRRSNHSAASQITVAPPAHPALRKSARGSRASFISAIARSRARAASAAFASSAASPSPSASSRVIASAMAPSIFTSTPCGTCSVVTLCSPGAASSVRMRSAAFCARSSTGTPSTGARKRTIGRLKTTTVAEFLAEPSFAVRSASGPASCVSASAVAPVKAAMKPSATAAARMEALSLDRRQQLLQFARLVHLAQDVATADELAVHVELRNRRPVGKLFDAFAKLIVLQHVERRIVRNAATFEDLCHGRRESALRKLRRAFHVENDSVLRDLVADRVLDVSHVVLQRMNGTILPQRSFFDGSRQTGDVVLDEERIKRCNGKRAEQRARHQRAPVVDIAFDELRDNADRHCFDFGRRDERQRIDELVPGKRKRENARRDQTRDRKRQDNPHEYLPAARAVDQRAFLELIWDRFEVTHQEPRAKRNQK